MKNEHENSLQYRFTAYLLRALENQIKNYQDRKSYLEKWEYADMEPENRGGASEFDIQYHLYQYEQYAASFRKEDGLQRILSALNEQKLIKALFALKDREKAILMARIFGELTFAEIGELFDMKPRQAEMAYYYIIRKLRKRMEG